MKLTKSPLYPIGSLMFYLFIPVAYGKMNKAMVARLTGHSYSDKRNILPINPKYDRRLFIKLPTCSVRAFFHQIFLNARISSKLPL
jgi:hypothetical protein